MRIAIDIETNKAHNRIWMASTYDIDTKVRVLKNRHSGLTGPCASLYYDRVTGRMNQLIEDNSL